MTDLERIRRAAGWSRDKAAVMAGVSTPTCRVYEQAGPEHVKDPRKRAGLDRVYSELREIALRREAA